jgi:4-amino-4-deoxy-L-arabinose transferase-like glycosyltransferase
MRVILRWPHSWAAWAWPVGLALCCCFLFFYRLADRDLWSSHEARAAQDAQSMLLDGEWGLPRLIDGKPDLQKPPLFYWLVALAARAASGAVDAWAVRLPVALSALLAVAGLFGLLAARRRPVAGLVAAALLATMGHFTWLARVGRIDMPLTLAVGLAAGSFYLATRPDRRPMTRFGLQLLGYLAIAAGVLLKGPIGAVLPTVVLLGHSLLERLAARQLAPRRAGSASVRSEEKPVAKSATESARPLFSLCWGVPLVLLLTVPWYWWANQHTHGEFFRVFFWHHNIERGMAASDDGSMHARPWWFYASRLGPDLLPASLLLPVALWYVLRRGRWRTDAEARLGLSWLASTALFLSLLGFKRADYLLPAYPGAALLLGCIAEHWYCTAQRPGRLAATLAAGLAASVGGWWVYIDRWLPQEDAHNQQRTFAAAIRRLVPPPQQVMFFRTEDHLLYFHLGRPIHTFLEWENLDVWAGRPGCHYIVMDSECAAQWPQYISSGRLEPVIANTSATHTEHKHPLVLMRTVPRRSSSVNRGSTSP